MAHSILVTGASGYLGGTLLALLNDTKLPSYKKLFALVRTDEQAEAVKQYHAEPLRADLGNEEAIVAAIVDNEITIVYHLTSAMSSTSQQCFIKGLSKVKEKTKLDVHLLHTSGAKIFSSHAGAPTGRLLYDDQEDLYEIQRHQQPPVKAVIPAVQANTTIIDIASQQGVNAYIFVPCIVYGEGRGFGNKISIQTQAIVRAAKATRSAYSVNEGKPTWPVCHVDDNARLYLTILERILSGSAPPSGQQGFYLASPGSVAWFDIYAAFATALNTRGVVDSKEVKLADAQALQAMADGLGCPKELVELQLGGLCTFTARRGGQIGWKPKYSPEHILQVADKEVELILQHMK